MNTKIKYMYRDADNYKDFTTVVVSGKITKEQIERIMAKLEDGENFIPEQLGLPANRLNNLAFRQTG